MGRLIYLSRTRPEIAYTVGRLIYTDAHWVGSMEYRRSTTGYCIFIGGNLVTWRSKKQAVVARSSVETEYRAMALGVCELLWTQYLLTELGLATNAPMSCFATTRLPSALLMIQYNTIGRSILRLIDT